MSEEWRSVTGWPAYEVSDAGRVRRGDRIKKPTIAANGYFVVNLSRPSSRRVLTVHRLVCEAFLGPCPSPRHEVAHWNGDKLDARLSNLRWATSAENSADIARHGRTNRGERSGTAKLSSREVDEIKRRLNGGESVVRITCDFPTVSKYAIYGIKWGRTWALPA